jgi:hypothetical protein
MAAVESISTLQHIIGMWVELNKMDMSKAQQLAVQL